MVNNNFVEVIIDGNPNIIKTIKFLIENSTPFMVTPLPYDEWEVSLRDSMLPKIQSFIYGDFK